MLQSEDTIELELSITDQEGLGDETVSQTYLLSREELEATHDDQTEQEYLQEVINRMGESVSILWDQKRDSKSKSDE